MAKSDVQFPFIKNKDLFQAVTFACEILRRGTYRSFTDACRKASRYYQVKLEDVMEQVRLRNRVNRTLNAKGKNYRLRDKEDVERTRIEKEAIKQDEMIFLLKELERYQMLIGNEYSKAMIYLERKEWKKYDQAFDSWYELVKNMLIEIFDWDENDDCSGFVVHHGEIPSDFWHKNCEAFIRDFVDANRPCKNA